MKKRLVLLLMVFAILLAMAPLAMADHCVTCKNFNCRPATSGGAASCTQGVGSCTLSGTCGGPHPFTEEPFGAEFIVASVERLDERQPAPAEETRVASLETTPAPAQR